MKYMGSKARIAKQILSIILKDRQPEQWYVEPFAGGMNSICHVDGKRLASDANYFLIEMWIKLIDGWLPPAEVSRGEYAKIKSCMSDYPPELVGWVGFNCSYSGKWFGGYAGKTKTKTGTVRDYQLEAAKNVHGQSALLRGTVFANQLYWKLALPPNSIVYCDPPYANTTKYHEDFDHELFWQWAANLGELGHTVFVSEYEVPSFHKNDWQCVWEQPIRSSLSANGRYGGSKQSIERLFALKALYC